MHTTHISLSLDQRQQVIAALNALLADAIDLSLQTKLSHWNVRGPHFYSLHLLFDKVTDQIREAADMIAERIAQLGGVARGSLQEVAQNSSLGKLDSDLSKGTEVIAALVQGMADFTNNCRKQIETVDTLGDAITADILTRITGETDQNLWFVEAHLQ